MSAALSMCRCSAHTQVRALAAERDALRAQIDAALLLLDKWGRASRGRRDSSFNARGSAVDSARLRACAAELRRALGEDR